MIKEFKEFINRGNVIDLAVGVIIGGAFGKIVTSLVNDVLMPIIGIFIGGLNFANLNIVIGKASINYGLFIQNIIDFLIVAGCIFFIIRTLNKLNSTKDRIEEKLEKKFKKNGSKEEQTPVDESVNEPVKEIKTEEVVLLEQIRDLLKSNNKSKK